MISRPARYLLRFDDFCPTMDRARWERFGGWIEELGLRPLLGVVPDNRDSDLQQAPADPEFWPWLRQREAWGATIGMHGFRHVCQSRSGGLLPLHEQTEFAGVAEQQQREWISEGLKRLRAEGLVPRLFIAPRHGFDRGTLRALRAEGLPAISDGFAERAFQRGGVRWIPQQIWEPVEKPRGLWTICIHANTASDAFVARLERFVREHREQMTGVEQILGEGAGRLGPLEWTRAEARLARVLLSKRWKRLRG
jgi:hypothetical protein